MVSLSDDQGIYLLEFVNRKHLKKEWRALALSLEEKQTPSSILLEQELREYFLGERKSFDLPLVMHGTDFQRKVWLELVQIPLGQTRTYKEIAQKIGNPKSSIAVGAANAANHFAIVVPCHRLKKSSGDLAGYAAGIWRKEWLLKFEEEMEYGKKKF